MEILLERDKYVDPWENTTPTDNIGPSSIRRSSSSGSNNSVSSDSLSSSTETIKNFKKSSTSNFDLDKSDYDDYFREE